MFCYLRLPGILIDVLLLVEDFGGRLWLKILLCFVAGPGITSTFPVTCGEILHLVTGT
jgi:hypothetical protein